jgi:hypothetical protein
MRMAFMQYRRFCNPGLGSWYAGEGGEFLRTLSRREKGLLGLLGIAVAGLGLWALRQPGTGPLALAPRPEAALPPIPRIDLARLDAKRPENPAGRRDLFDYGAAPALEAAQTQAPPPPVPVNSAPAVASGPVTPTLPPLNLKYIGSVENAAGVKVAVLLTDRRELLTGQAGQVVANRYRISRIGLESVDLEDLNSGQARRIPLRGN